MAPARDWAKLHEDWNRNRKVRKVLRRFGPTAGGYWALLVGRAMAESHHVDNPSGVIRCSLQDLADELCDVQEDPAPMWDAFVRAKLIVIRGAGWRTDLERDVEIELLSFGEWQVPKGGPAYRQQDRRERQKTRDVQGFVTDASRPVTTCHDSSQVVTQTETESKRETEKREEKKPPSPKPNPVRAPRRVSKADPEQVTEQIRDCQERLGDCAPLVAQLVQLLAEENKTGAVAESRALRELWKPLADIAATFTRQQMQYALGEAVQRGKPHANYVKAIAANYRAGPAQRPPTPLTSPSPKEPSPYDQPTIRIA